MNTLLQITAQYYENYGSEIHGIFHDAWKAKGSQVFTLRVNSDSFMYAETECLKAIDVLLAKQSNKHELFTYVAHELIFQEPIALNDAEFESELLYQCEQLGRMQR